MNNIFVRIYGGLVLAFVFISLSSVLLVNQFSDYRTEKYHTGISLGTIKLVADGAAQREGSERDKWLQVVNRLLGEKIEWLAEAPNKSNVFPFDKHAVKERSQWVNFVEQDGILYTEIYVPVPGEQQGFLFVRLYEMTEQQVRGLAHLIVDSLGANEGDRWQHSLKTIQRYFEFPLTIKPRSDLDVDLAQTARLNRGEVVVGLADGFGTDSTFNVIAPLRADNQYVEMGPVRLSNWLPINLVVIGGVVSLAIMALVVYLLVRPLQQRLAAMSDAVQRIHKGDLSARVVIDGADSIDRLAKTINTMAEHIQRLIQSQREMMNAVSHELRTPVARIRFGLEMIEDTEDRSMRGKHIEGIDADIEELNTLIDEILTYARLEEGTPSLNIQTVDVEALVRQVKRESEGLGTTIQIEYRPACNSGDDKFAECEERYIHRIVQNLVGNALRYAHSRVHISCSVEGGMYRLDVEDDGDGILAQDWDKVFVPFARLDNSRTRASGGYGLGLSIVARIAYWHGGVASVNKSGELGGARFTIIWPKTVAMREKVMANQIALQNLS